MKIIRKSTKKEISERLLHLIEHTHLYLTILNNDLEFEFGKSILNEKIGKSKNNDKLYLTLRDQFGNVLDNLINEGLNLVTILDLNEDNFRDNLDNILNKSSIFSGEYNYWTGLSTDIESMGLETGIKNWWSRIKKS